jgi:predicted nucleic acid-binding protein
VVLPDTSIWVEYFRDAQPADADHLAALIAEGEVAICGPVIAELLAGTRPSRRDALLETMLGLPWAGIDPDGWLQAGEASAELRRKGTPLALTDLAIAAAAAGGGHVLWSLDADFERIREVLEGLELYSRP